MRRIDAKTSKGLHRITWDMRLSAPDPIDLQAPEPSSFAQRPIGPLATPAQYSAQLVKQIDGKNLGIGSSQTFQLNSLGLSPEQTDDPEALQRFQLEVAQLLRAVAGAQKSSAELRDRIAHLRQALDLTDTAGSEEQAQLATLLLQLNQIDTALNGDTTRRSRNEPTPLSISNRVFLIRRDAWKSQAPATGVHRDSYRIAADEFTEVMQRLSKVQQELQDVELTLEQQGAPWTPGRLPIWPPR